MRPRILVVALGLLAAFQTACNTDREVPPGPCNGGVCVGDTDAGRADTGGADPCAGVACNTPPSQCHAAVGACTNGQCDYALAPGQACSDGNACTENDICGGDGTCSGTLMACSTPPDPTCSDANTSVVYDDQGTCALGMCNYVNQSVSCPGQCGQAEPGLCPDPCAGRLCNTPPTACYEPTGMCNPRTGACTYTVDPAITSCNDGDGCTVNDACQASGACSGTGIVCASPPAAMCTGGNILRTFSATGAICNAGTSMCDYPFMDTDCGAAGCANGACNSTCNETTCTPWRVPATPNGTAVRTCGDTACATSATLPPLDLNYFRCRIQPILDAGCAYMGCHTTDTPNRRLQTYSVGLKRMAPLLSGTDHDGPINPTYCNTGNEYPEANCGRDPITIAEATFNYDNTRLFALGVTNVATNELLTQPLAGDPAGHAHGGFDLYASVNDVRYGAIRDWLNGMTTPANCGGLTMPAMQGQSANGLNTRNGTCPDCSNAQAMCVPPPDQVYPCNPTDCSR